MRLYTRPRLLYAELLRSGDDIAVLPVPAPHHRDETCTCTFAPGEPIRHCATRYLPSRSLQLVEHNPNAVVWWRIVGEPRAVHAENHWFGTTRVRITGLPLVDGVLTEYKPGSFVCDLRDQMVSREWLDSTAEVEGQPERPAGITPLRLVTGTAKKPYAPDPDRTQVLASSRVPVGVQVVELTGDAHPAGYEHQHDDRPEVLDFTSERDSEA